MVTIIIIIYTINITFTIINIFLNKKVSKKFQKVSKSFKKFQKSFKKKKLNIIFINYI